MNTGSARSCILSIHSPIGWIMWGGFLSLLFSLTGCHGPQRGSSSVDEYRGPAFQYPFTVLHRVEGVDGLTWRFVREGCPIDEGLALQAMEKAFQRWSQSTGLLFQLAPDDQEAFLTIQWKAADHGRPCIPFGVSSELVGHICTAPDSGDATPYSIHLNAGVDWDLSEDAAEESQAPPGLRVPRMKVPRLTPVLVHEIGHVLGLGHVAAGPSTMRPLQGQTLEHPGKGDVQGIHSLYGGGEVSTDADLEICCVDPQGEAHLAAPVIRGLAPRNRVRVHAVDIDGNGSQELLLMCRGKVTDGSGLLILQFAAGAVLEKTMGPFPGMLFPELPIAVGRSDEGETILVQARGVKGHYRALVIPRSEPIPQLVPPGMRWSSVAGGGGDGNGDGILDRPIGGISPVSRADLDGDGIQELIRRRGDRGND